MSCHSRGRTGRLALLEKVAYQLEKGLFYFVSRPPQAILEMFSYLEEGE